MYSRRSAIRLLGLGLTGLCVPKGFSAEKWHFPTKIWDIVDPQEVGMSSQKVAEALALIEKSDSGWDFARDQQRVFGKSLGEVAESRARVNAVIVKDGYLVGQVGDVLAPDPVYSVAKSFLSTLVGLAVKDELIASIDQRVGAKVQDRGYVSKQNYDITWRQHLLQTSEWEGNMFGKASTFLGKEEFGEGERQPRELKKPGDFYEYNDVRVNRLSLSLMNVWGKPLPEILAKRIMNPIGASSDWKWLPYSNSGDSVPGGSRWGGGLWMSSLDMARFGLFVMRNGRWGKKQILSEGWLNEATTPGPQKKDYGLLWWLNNNGDIAPAGNRTAFAAIGNGTNTIYIDPANDLVVVVRWHKKDAFPAIVAAVMAALKK
jgi:CubicO group peptidase (beta-lactamase class C family)